MHQKNNIGSGFGFIVPSTLPGNRILPSVVLGTLLVNRLVASALCTYTPQRVAACSPGVQLDFSSVPETVFCALIPLWSFGLLLLDHLTLIAGGGQSRCSMPAHSSNMAYLATNVAGYCLQPAGICRVIRSSTVLASGNV